MNAAKYARAKAVFLNVCSLPSVAWESALDRECAGDPSLRTDVETLLAHHQSESILDAPPHQPRIVQVAFGGATSEKWNEEQRQFLHQRIRVWILVVHLLIALVLFRAFSYLDSWSKLSTFSASGIIVGCIGISALSILTVLLRAPSFLWLRRIELMLLGLGTMVICCWSYGWFKNGGSVAVSISRNVDERLASLYWIISADRFTHFRLSPAMLGFPSANFFAVITSMYAVVIPQTTRRLIVIIIAMLLLAGATILAAAAANPDLRPFVLRNIASNYLLVLGGGGICSYIGLKVQALRRAVFDAKQVGQYQLTRLLGKGGMGEVYLGQHWLLRRTCAVKLIRPEQAGSEQALVRFEREVQAMAQLTHPNTVEVYDFGRTEDGTFFYAMEFLPGTTLEALVERHGPLPACRVVYLLSQVCGALAEAHAKGLVHRDIKPRNVTTERNRTSNDPRRFEVLANQGLGTGPIFGSLGTQLAASGSSLGRAGAALGSSRDPAPPSSCRQRKRPPCASCSGRAIELRSSALSRATCGHGSSASLS